MIGSVASAIEKPKLATAKARPRAATNHLAIAVLATWLDMP
jgi:hypothetical protein